VIGLALKLLFGNQNNLPASKTIGHIYACVDSGNLFLDFINNLGVLSRFRVNADKADKLRYTDANEQEQELLPQDIATKTEVAARVASAQGVEQSGKLMGVDANGNVVPVSMTEVGLSLTWGALAGQSPAAPAAEEDEDEEETGT